MESWLQFLLVLTRLEQLAVDKHSMSNRTSVLAELPVMEALQTPRVRTKDSVKQGEWLSFPVFAACVFACMVYLWIPNTVEDPDIWWHLRDAEFLISTHSFLTHDFYSFTALGSPWMNHEWLSELPFYCGWRLFGDRGIYLVTVAAIEAILLGVFYLAYRKSASISAAMIVAVLAAVISTVSFGPRTLLFGWVCLVLELLLLDRLLSDERYVWTLPILFCFWVNLHGSWVIGMVILAMFTVCAKLPFEAGSLQLAVRPALPTKRLLAWGCLSFGALFVNPYGWRLVAYPFDLAFRQKLNIANVEEWKTLDFHSPRGKIFLVSLGLLFVLQLLKRTRWTLYELALVLIGVYAAATYSRFLFLGAILIMPILAKYLPINSNGKGARNAGWMGLLVLLAMVPVIKKRFPTETSMRAAEKNYPLKALPFLQRMQPDGRVFNEFIWGGFLEWNVRQLPVFLDSRVDIFEYNGTFRDYLDVIRLKDTLAILDRQQIRYVLFEREAPLTYFLEHSGGWKVNYQDETTILLERCSSCRQIP